jgi:glycosyltransferase involved in cell wall biosynthesis
MISMNPLISVVIPVYNVEKSIVYMLESIIHQTYRNTEIILVDDGSGDNSVTVAQNVLLESCMTWKLIKKKNGGAASARNLGIANSDGDWIICPDSDDYLAPQMLERLLAEAVKAGSLCASCEYQSAYEKDIPNVRFCEKSVKTYSAGVMQKLFLERKLMLISPGLLIHRSVAEKVRYNEACPYDEDVYYVWEILFSCNKVTFLDCNYYLYITREGSSVHSLKTEHYLATSKEYKKLEEWLLRSQPERQEIIRRIHPKYVLGGLHVLARSSSFDVFRAAAKKEKSREEMLRLIFYPDIKLSLYSLIYCLSLRVFYFISRR